MSRSKEFCQKKLRGFTLIELLVVIAIIGILASVVFPSFNSSRAKSQDAKIKAEISQAPSQASLYYEDSVAGYTDICLTGAPNDLSEIRASLEALSASVVCADDVNFWAIEAQLKTTADYYCMDSAGNTIVNTSGVHSIADGGTPDYVCGP